MTTPNSRDGIRNWPGFPSWFLVVLGFGICVLVACRAQSADGPTVASQQQPLQIEQAL